MRMVIASPPRATSRIVSMMPSSVSESSDEVASSKTSRCGCRSSARAIESRCFSPPETLTPPSPMTVSSPRSARASRLSHAACRSTSKQSASDADGFTNSRFSRIVPGEQLRVLRDEADPRPQAVEIDLVAGDAVVEDAARLRRVQAHQQLHQRRLAGARRPDEGHRFAPPHIERDVAEAPETTPIGAGSDILERQRLQSGSGTGCAGRGSGIFRMLLEEVERDLGLAVDVDDVAELLQRSENEERVDEQREELADGDRPRVDQVTNSSSPRASPQSAQTLILLPKPKPRCWRITVTLPPTLPPGVTLKNSSPLTARWSSRILNGWMKRWLPGPLPKAANVLFSGIDGGYGLSEVSVEDNTPAASHRGESSRLPICFPLGSCNWPEPHCITSGG